jgi:hypothetical protein
VGESDQLVAVGFDDRMHQLKFSHLPDDR